jgi:hypothetical protein
LNSNESPVSIANAALGKIGIAVISSLFPPDANSKGAIRVSNVYNQLRDFVLSQHPWTFAKKTTALAQLVQTVPNFGDGVSIAYAIPSDWIKPNKWNFPNAIIRLEAGAIYSDTLGLMVKYTFANNDPTTYSPEFIEALATKIAAEVCYDLTNNVGKAKELQDEFTLKLGQAISADSMNDTPDQAIADEWFIARLSGAQTSVPLPGQVTF